VKIAVFIVMVWIVLVYQTTQCNMYKDCNKLDQENAHTLMFCKPQSLMMGQ